MDILLELSVLTDREANQCLSRVLAGIAAIDPEIPITSPDELGGILKEAAASIGTEGLRPKIDADLGDNAKAARLILLEFLQDPQLHARLEAALAADRRVLVEPITTALVMAGIVVILKTKFKMTFKRDSNKKSEFHVSIKKEPASDKTLRKFFSLF